MEKHIHHLPHFAEGLMHSMVLLGLFLRTKVLNEKDEYPGDNFPTWK